MSQTMLVQTAVIAALFGVFIGIMFTALIYSSLFTPKPANDKKAL
jgi:hypothetical protein